MPSHTAERPNVVYIDCHDLGDWLGCYERPYLDTPHLDRMAAGGVRFTRHTATAPICMPSRASILTGLMPHEVGVTGQESLAPTATCMAARFRDAGYRTVVCGRLMILNDPQWVGFSEQLAADDDDKAAAAAAFIGAQHASSAPFLLSVSLFQCHRPFGPDYDLALTERIAVPGYLPDTSATRRDLATLAWQIREMDVRVGRILAAVDAAGLRDSTLVVFTTEHGPAVARAKHTTYDSGLRTALLLRLPGVISAGSTVERLSSSVDLLPTVCELCGVPAPAAIHGMSWASYLAGERAAATREWAFSEFNWGRRSGQLVLHAQPRRPRRALQAAAQLPAYSHLRGQRLAGALRRRSGHGRAVVRGAAARDATLRPDSRPVRVARPGRDSGTRLGPGGTGAAAGSPSAGHGRPHRARAGAQSRR